MAKAQVELTREEILEFVIPFIQKRGEEVEPEDVTEDAVLESLGIDSIKLGALIGDLEEAMGFRVPPEERQGEPPKTVGELLDRVIRRSGVAIAKLASVD